MKIEVHSPSIRRREMDAVLTQLVDEKPGPGEQTERLIQIAKENLQFDNAVALRSPASALCRAVCYYKSDTPEKDAALVSALSPLYYASAIKSAGMELCFCDVEEGSPVVSADAVRAAVAEAVGRGLNVRVLVLHETLGFLPDMSAIAETGIPFIEDCSASAGGSFDGAAAGSFGALAVLGLEERDLLTAGGGALLFACERRNAAVLRSVAELPPEYMLPDMNAAMAVVQFRETRRNAEKRAMLAGLYTDAALRAGRHKLPGRSEKFEYNNYAFSLVLETGMKDVAVYAGKKGVEVENAFFGCLAASALVPPDICPHARSLALRTMRFPLYPGIAEDDARQIARLIQTLP